MESQVDANSGETSDTVDESPGVGFKKSKLQVDQFGSHGWQLLVLFAAATTPPALAWVYATEDPPVATYVLIAAFLLGISLGGRWFLVRLGFDTLGSTYVVSVFVFLFMNSGAVLDRGIGRIPILLGAVLVALIAYRTREVPLLRMFISWGAIVLVAYPPILALTQRGSEQVFIEDPDSINTQLVAEKRDVVIVLADGYANSPTLAEVYGFDNSPFEEKLRALGFDVDSNVVANYATTQVSVPSLFQMNYLSVEDRLTGGDLDHLRSTLGGRNILSEWFRGQGYRHVYVESGWYGTQCGPEVDLCVAGPWPDEALWDIAYRSLLRDLPGFETGRSFNRGASRAITWLENDLEDLLQNGEPDLIYVHLLAPHAPLFLDEQCRSDPQKGIKSFSVATPDMSDGQVNDARDRYVSQVRCVNTVLERVASLANDNDAVAVMVSDHGPDSLLQLFGRASEWTDEQRRERFGVLAAVRAPGCDMRDLQSIVNVGRRLVSCMSSADFGDLATSTFGFEHDDGGGRIIEVDVPLYDSAR